MFPRNRFPRHFLLLSFILLVWCTASAAQTAIKMKLTCMMTASHVPPVVTRM